MACTNSLSLALTPSVRVKHCYSITFCQRINQCVLANAFSLNSTNPLYSPPQWTIELLLISIGVGFFSVIELEFAYHLLCSLLVDNIPMRSIAWEPLANYANLSVHRWMHLIFKLIENRFECTVPVYDRQTLRDCRNPICQSWEFCFSLVLHYTRTWFAHYFNH